MKKRILIAIMLFSSLNFQTLELTAAPTVKKQKAPKKPNALKQLWAVMKSFKIEGLWKAASTLPANIKNAVAILGKPEFKDAFPEIKKLFDELLKLQKTLDVKANPLENSETMVALIKSILDGSDKVSFIINRIMEAIKPFIDGAALMFKEGAEINTLKNKINDVYTIGIQLRELIIRLRPFIKKAIEEIQEEFQKEKEQQEKLNQQISDATESLDIAVKEAKEALDKAKETGNQKAIKEAKEALEAIKVTQEKVQQVEETIPDKGEGAHDTLMEPEDQNEVTIKTKDANKQLTAEKRVREKEEKQRQAIVESAKEAATTSKPTMDDEQLSQQIGNLMAPPPERTKQQRENRKAKIRTRKTRRVGVTPIKRSKSVPSKKQKSIADMLREEMGKRRSAMNY